VGLLFRPPCNYSKTRCLKAEDSQLAMQSCRRGSVIRMPVFGWQTFPDVRLIYGWHVTTLRVKWPLQVNQPGQLSLPSLPDE